MPASPRMGTSCALVPLYLDTRNVWTIPTHLRCVVPKSVLAQRGEVGQFRIIAPLCAKNVPLVECCHDAVSMSDSCRQANVLVRPTKRKEKEHDKGKLLL